MIKCYTWLLAIVFMLSNRPAGTAEAATNGKLKLVYAVNAGGQEHTDRNGITYMTDPLQGKVGTASDYGNHLLIIGRVHEQDEVLYRTERYHKATFGYDLPSDGDGEYALIMKFCEVYFNEPNAKVFDVVLNNKHTIVSELDIFHQVGRGTAHEEVAFFKISNGRLYYKDEESQVRNGMIRLDFIKGRYDNPKINAFALMKGDVTQIPRLSPISDDILPMDADMAVFHDRISADGNAAAHGQRKDAAQQKMGEQNNNILLDEHDGDIEEEEEIEEQPTTNTQDFQDFDSSQRLRKTSGPRQPNPYQADDSSLLLPILIAIGAFVPLLFCLCKL